MTKGLRLRLPTAFVERLTDGWERDPARVAELRRMIEESGVIRPLAVNLTGRKLWLANGHTRLAAARQMGKRTVPVRLRRGPYHTAEDPFSSPFSKSQVAAGQWMPITTFGRKSPIVADALRVRLKGLPVYHGGTKQRLSRINRGRRVDIDSGVGWGEDMGGHGVFTTLSPRRAESFAISGRHPRNFDKHGADYMNGAPEDVWEKGAVGAFDMKGVMPQRVAGGWPRYTTEIVYRPQDMKGRALTIKGVKPYRSMAIQRSRDHYGAQYERRLRRAKRMMVKRIDPSTRPEQDQWYLNQYKMGARTVEEKRRAAKRRIFGD